MILHSIIAMDDIFCNYSTDDSAPCYSCGKTEEKYVFSTDPFVFLNRYMLQNTTKINNGH